VPTTGASSTPSPITGAAAGPVVGAGVAAAVGVLGAAFALL
jgi:hypothetical protein